MKLKQHTALFLSLFLSVSLAACGTSPISDSAQAFEVSSASSGPSSPSSAPVLSEPLQMIRSGEQNGQGMGNGTGFYSLSINEDGSRNLIYTDYATRKQLYLCNRPECTHSDDSCTSYMGVMYGGGNVFLMGDHLLLMQGGSYSYVEEVGEAALPTFYTAALDGSERRVCARLKAVEEIEGGLACSGEKLYFIKNILATGPDEQVSSALVQLNLETGQETTLKTFVQPTFLYGVAGEALAVKDLSEMPMASSAQEWEQLSNARIHTLSLIDTAGNELWQTQWSHGEILGGYFGSDLYQLDLHTRQLTRTDLTTGVQREIGVFPYEVDSANTAMIQLLDGRLIIELTDPGETPADRVTDWYAVDCADGSVIPLTLKREERGRQQPILVWDSYSDYYYICPKAQDSGMGFSYPTNALILKSDYWQGRAEYLWVESA